MAISYSGTPYYSTANLTTATVTNTGAVGGTYTSTAGLSINASSGEINLIASTPGNYTVTYTVVTPGPVTTITTTSIDIFHSFADMRDLYNQTLLLDKSYVDACIAEIKAEIFRRVTSVLEPFFDYDSEPIIGALEPIQQYRIKDQITLQLRSVGIRVSIGPNYVANIIYPSIPIETSFKIGISWFIRDAQEFMKTYV